MVKDPISDFALFMCGTGARRRGAANCTHNRIHSSGIQRKVVLKSLPSSTSNGYPISKVVQAIQERLNNIVGALRVRLTILRS